MPPPGMYLRAADSSAPFSEIRVLCEAPLTSAWGNPYSSFPESYKFFLLLFYLSCTEYILSTQISISFFLQIIFPFTEIEIKYKYLCVYNKAISGTAKESVYTFK